MRCKNCGIEISDDEIFCNDCKLELKQVTSREELRELKELIEEQKKINDLEDTKELVTLDNLEAKNNSALENEDIKIDEEIDKPIKEEVKVDELFNNNQNIPPKKDNKKLIIIISILAFIIVLLVILLIFFLNPKEEKKDDPNNIDYELILNTYGDDIKSLTENFITENKKVPTFDEIDALLNQTEVYCDIHEIYEDGNIYLSSCKVDGKSIENTYGKKQEVQTFEKLTIYKSTSNAGDEYNVNGGEEVGTVTCKTGSCVHYASYKTYSIIKEDGEFYIYNYETDSLVFGPFELVNDVVLDNDLYAVLYKKDGIQNMYSLTSFKELKNIDGIISNSSNESIMYKYGYIVLKNNDKYNFINLKTGNISYSITCASLKEFIEDKNNNIVYIKANTSNDKFQMYNSNGKLLFDGVELNDFKLYSDKIVISYNNIYKTYDLKLNLKLTGTIIDTYEKVLVILNNNKLQLLNKSDQVLVTFNDNLSNYKYKKDLSGYKTYNDKSGLYLNFVNESLDINSEDYTLMYYYIEETSENGVIKNTVKNDDENLDSNTGDQDNNL